MRGDLVRVNVGELSVLSAKPRFEIYLALMIVGVSLLLPGAGYRDALFQLIFVSVILLAQHFPLAVFAPIPVASIIWASGYVDQWHLAPIIVYMAVHVISFRVGVMAAVVVSCEWIILAYIISVQSSELEAWLYSFILELFLLALLIFMGRNRRNRFFKEHQAREERARAKERLFENLNQYLHDSVARKLTMMTIHADRIHSELDVSPEHDRIGEVAELGRSALMDLEELIREMKAGTTGHLSSTDGMWSPEPLSQAVRSAMVSLEDMGFDVVFSGNIDPGPLPSSVENALTLSFQEAVVNTVKYAPARSRVYIEMAIRDYELGLVLANTMERGGSGRICEFSSGLGLSGMSRRLEGMGGRVAVTSTPGSWSIDLAAPVEIDKDEGNV